MLDLGEVLEFVVEKHKGQKRVDGSPVYLHNLRISRILEDMGHKTSFAKAVGMLHDIKNRTDASKEEIVDKFGVDVAEMVFYEGTLEAAPSLVKQVMLADRLDNLRNLQGLDQYHRAKYIQETEQVLQSVGDVIGCDSVKQEVIKRR